MDECQQAIRGDVFEPPLDLREMGGRQAGRLGNVREAAPRCLSTITEDSPQRCSHLICGFALSEGHLLVAK